MYRKFPIRSHLFVTPFCHIDCGDFIFPPHAVRPQSLLPSCTEEQARAAFLRAGWNGDGDLGLIWLPPFVLGYPDTLGLLLWHVRQEANGTSWLCNTVPIELPGFRDGDVSTWMRVAL